MNELEEISLRLEEAERKINVLEQQVFKLLDYVAKNPPTPISTQFPKWSGGKQI